MTAKPDVWDSLSSMVGCHSIDDDATLAAAIARVRALERVTEAATEVLRRWDALGDDDFGEVRDAVETLLRPALSALDAAGGVG